MCFRINCTKCSANKFLMNKQNKVNECIKVTTCVCMYLYHFQNEFRQIALATDSGSTENGNSRNANGSQQFAMWPRIAVLRTTSWWWTLQQTHTSFPLSLSLPLLAHSFARSLSNVRRFCIRTRDSWAQTVLIRIWLSMSTFTTNNSRAQNAQRTN